MDVGDKQGAKTPFRAFFTQGVTTHACSPNGFV